MEEFHFTVGGFKFKYVNQGLLFYSNDDWRLDSEHDTLELAKEAAKEIVDDYYDMWADM